jgi:tripartite-type tricarboxylate transporter receptor subunit TctC
MALQADPLRDPVCRRRLTRRSGPSDGRLGQNVVVENRPGAGGTIGADSVARAAADGHTFLFTAQGPLVLNPFLMKRLPYNAETAFAPVTIVAETPNVLVTNQAFPVFASFRAK